MSNAKRLLVYVVPVTVLSFSLNIPKFMEITVRETNGTNVVDPSQTRKDPTFIFWYTLSLIWHPTLTTGVLPFLALAFMNLKIFLGIRKQRKIFRNSQNNQQRSSESNLAITLVKNLIYFLYNPVINPLNLSLPGQHCVHAHSLQLSQSFSWCSCCYISRSVDTL